MIQYILLFIIIFITICILLFFLFFILSLLIAYLFVYYLLQINNNFVDYNENTKKMINKYGDYKIVKMYYYKEKLSDFTIFITNIITRYKYYHNINKNKFQHAGILLVVKNSHNKLNFLKIDKISTSIHIYENFKITSYKKIKSVSIHKNKYSLKELLDKTRKNMGEINFFNWELKKNNCQTVIKLDKKIYIVNLYNQINLCCM
jgi:hypothetical protein